MEAPEHSAWKGYSLEEIRMRRLIGLTHIELQKASLANATQHLTHPQKGLISSPIISKIAGALDYVDYAILAYNIARKALKIFRRKKR